MFQVRDPGPDLSDSEKLSVFMNTRKDGPFVLFSQIKVKGPPKSSGESIIIIIERQ